MVQLWHLVLYQPLVNALIFLYQLLFHNFGLALIVLTVAIRLLLLPLTRSSMKATARMRELAPELEKLKKKYGKDKQAYAKAQMELYKQHGANPAAGCVPQIIQLIVLIALYQAFIQVWFLSFSSGFSSINFFKNDDACLDSGSERSSQNSRQS